ncbi:MAG: hypothetical protein JO157_02125 [Acetobacteraceae bacterium]|nr:hypothetical protein [Acetobacteraceae bacterium]
MFSFKLLDHDPLDGAVEFEVVDPAEIRVMHVIAILKDAPGNVLVLDDFTVYGAGPMSAGPSLRRAATDFLRTFGYAELHIQGTRRSSGAGPGRIPRPVRFR